MAKHLIFYDGQCGLCDRMVQLVLRQDPLERFDFAPLEGLTAAKMLKSLPPEKKTGESLILIEDYRETNQHFYIFGKAIFRICWLLGGFWSIPGLLFWLPSFLYDSGYRLVSKNRHKLFKNEGCTLPIKENEHRFLP